MTDMGVGGYSKGKGQNPTRGTPPTGMFGQLMGREDLAAHSRFGAPNPRGRHKRTSKKPMRPRSSRRGTKKAGS